LGGPERGEDVRVERIIIGLRVSFRGQQFPDLTETYELTIDGEQFTVEVRDGAVETRPGSVSSPSLSLTTDARTFIALLTGELTVRDSLAHQRAVIEGERVALTRFIDAFSFGSSA